MQYLIRSQTSLSVRNTVVLVNQVMMERRSIILFRLIIIEPYFNVIEFKIYGDTIFEVLNHIGTLQFPSFIDKKYLVVQQLTLLSP